MGKQLILGSGSPRRQQILRDSGYVFEIKVTDEDEIADPAMKVEDVPEDLARQKAGHILPDIQLEDFVLLTSDTVVVLDGEIIGKPKDMDEATAYLRRLSGRTHQVVSGVCFSDKRRTASFSDITEVNFQELSEDEIQYYVSKYEVLDKAGAYAIQEWIGLIGIASINGSYYNVMGLPMHKVYEELKKWNIFPEGDNQ